MCNSIWVKKQLEKAGHWFFYVMLYLFGHRGGLVLLGPVICIYVVFSRKIRRTVRYYLEHRFPGQTAARYWRNTYRNLFAFGHVLVDRGWLGVRSGASFEGAFVGYDTLIDLIGKKKGVVLLTAHVGNWQAALSKLGKLPVKVHALMQYDRQAAAKHFFDLKRGSRSFEIIDAEGPFGGMVDATAALQRGEVVTIMGDRFIKGSCSQAYFFSESVRLPDSAYMLAASTGAPVVIVFAAKTGRTSYQLKVWDCFYPHYEDRNKRGQMLAWCTARFSKALENYLQYYPFQWYNFYNFWKQ